MVKQTLAIFHKEIRGVLHAAYFLAGFSLLSQLLALVRDRIFAATFGADKMLDLYYAAFRIPDFIFVIVSSLISVSVLIPLLQSRMADGDEKAKDFLSNIFSAFFICIGGAALIAFFIVPYIVPSLFPELKAQSYELVVMTRLMLLSPILLGISNLFASVTQAKQRFALYALCPVFYNIGIILGVAVFYPLIGSIYALAAGVVFGALLHAGIQIPYMVSLGVMPRFSRVEWKSIWNIARISLPRTLSLSISEITEFVMVIIAGMLTVGSISIFSLSWNLQSVPLSIIGVSYSVALFPILSKLIRDGDERLFLEKVVHTTRHVIFLGAITTAVFIIVRAQIVRTIFGAGQFNWDDTRLTAAALALFVLSLIPQCLILVLTRAFYALGNTKTPFVTNLSSSVVMIVTAFLTPYFYVQYPAFHSALDTALKVVGIEGTEVLMLPLVFSIGSFINALLLGIFFTKKVKGFASAVLPAIAIHVTSAVIAACASYFCLYATASMFNTEKLLGIFGQGFIAGLAGIGTGILFLYIIKNQEFTEFVESFTKSKRKPIAGPDATM